MSSFLRSSIGKQARVLLLSTKHNGLSQRIALELKRKNHDVEIQEVQTAECMISAVESHRPDIIACPFLKQTIPEAVWSRQPCLIVHPGIAGDRGASSLDWAISEEQAEWGVTVLQAEKELDHGLIWSTANFPMCRPDINTLTKSSLYTNEITNTAVNCLSEALERLCAASELPRILDYKQDDIRGSLKRNMVRADRIIDWTMTDEEVALRVRMSDSAPGAIARFLNKSRDGKWVWSDQFRAFGAYLERGNLRHMRGEPGQILGQRDNAILVKCGEGSIWLSHLKRSKLKLPAMDWINKSKISDQTPILGAGQHAHLQCGQLPETFQEIWTTLSAEGICNVNFNFYNGAMSTYQCNLLHSVLEKIEEDDQCKVIVLRGGFNFFSNGINLNTIENSNDPARESWKNINAINDVVLRIASSKKITISALQGNAGAGGFMMSLASDLVVARKGVVLNPHYKLMHLFGSEYHTYFLRERLGERGAARVLGAAEPMLAEDAADIGLIDSAMGRGAGEFEEHVRETALTLARFPDCIKVTRRERRCNVENFQEKLDGHRATELEQMSKDFSSATYAETRRAFVLH